MDETVAIARARKLLKDADITTAPVDVESLALAVGFKVSRKELPEGEAGSTFERRGQKHMWVNERCAPPGQRNTTIPKSPHP